MEATTRTSDELNWKLLGIRSERSNIEARLKFLENEERRLTSVGLTGTPKAGKGKTKKAAPATGQTRKRALSEETRQKMRDAAHKRWAGKSKTSAAAAPAPEAAAEAPPESPASA